MKGRGPYRVWLAGWTGITALAVTNGVSRSLYVRRLGETRAHQVSAVTLVAVVLPYARLVQRRWPLPTAQAAARVGAAWVGLTVVFEFGFGHFVAKQSWSRLLSDYDLRRGRMWPFVLVAVGTAPALARVTPRRDIRRWGATDEEVRRQLPGDDAAPDGRNVGPTR